MEEDQELSFRDGRIQDYAVEGEVLASAILKIVKLMKISSRESSLLCHLVEGATPLKRRLLMILDPQTSCYV